MDKQLETTMRLEMQIQKYDGESQLNYEGRLIYSALANWIRYIILDETDLPTGVQSKAYVLRRANSVLNNFIESIPSVKNWIVPDNSDIIDISETVKAIRDRMISSGELLEVDSNNNLGLPEHQFIKLNNNCSQVIGINKIDNAYKCAGVSRITESTSESTASFLWNTLPIEEVLERTYNSSKFRPCLNLDDYEFFNPYSKKTPSKSWDSVPIRDQHHIIGRTTIINGMNEYYVFLHSNDVFSYYKLPDILTEKKEERRILLGLRSECSNPMEVKYSYAGSVILLHLFCRLPLVIENIIYAFSWPLYNINDFQNFVIPAYLWSNLKNMFEIDLGMKLTKEE